MSDSDLPFKTHLPLRNIMGILPIMTSRRIVFPVDLG
jgi:hypothetical protein